MKKSTTLNELEEIHNEMAVIETRKFLENIRFKVNPNDVPWMFWNPIIDRNLGNSRKVYYKLLMLKL